jgi:hypothetical protein
LRKLRKIFYRISDNSYPKNKLPGITKEICLKNFLNVFPKEEIIIIADNCNESLSLLSGLNYYKTKKNNAGSLKFALDMAICFDEDTLVYFVEDDYLHLPKANKLLNEGIQIADYVTLFDHPDKYVNGGEISKVIKTESSHWRYTISTCMTFATTVKTLKEDFEIWEKWTKDLHPHDHYVFLNLASKEKSLAVCLPGVTCHTDLTYSEQIGKYLIEDWATDYLLDIYKNDKIKLSNLSKLQQLMGYVAFKSLN